MRTNVQHGLRRPRPVPFWVWFPLLLIGVFALSVVLTAVVMNVRAG